MKDRHKFALCFVILIILYVWLRAREKAHTSIAFTYAQKTLFKKNDEKNDDENDEENEIHQNKIQFLLGMLHSELNWITIRVFAISVFILIGIQAFGFVVSMLHFDFEKAQQFTFPINTTNHVNNSNSLNSPNSSKNEPNGFLSKLKKKISNFKDHTVTHIFENPENVNQVGTNEILDVVYTFAISLKFIVLSFIFIYAFNYTYAYFIIQKEDHLDEEGLHMHADIIIFTSLIILLYLLVYMAYSV